MHEAFVADIAHEWFLASVDTSMCYERRAFYKSFTTDFTAEAFVCRVNAGVTNKIGTLCEQLVTHITLERPNRSSKTCYIGFSIPYFRDKWHIWMKGTCMVGKGVTVTKAFVAYLTNVRFITCVRAGVNHKVVTEPEFFIAHFTDEGFVSRVDASMCY
jgi:hypothetical protein